MDGASRPFGRLLEAAVRVVFDSREDVAFVEPVCARLRLLSREGASLWVGLDPTNSTSPATLVGLPFRLDEAFVVLSTTFWLRPPPKGSVVCFTLRFVSVRFSIGAFLVLESRRTPPQKRGTVFSGGM